MARFQALPEPKRVEHGLGRGVASDPSYNFRRRHPLKLKRGMQRPPSWILDSSSWLLFFCNFLPQHRVMPMKAIFKKEYLCKPKSSIFRQ
jgi:hypothetical protein